MNFRDLNTHHLVQQMRQDLQTIFGAMPELATAPGADLQREQVVASMNSFVSQLKARGMPVDNVKVTVQKVQSYTISKQGKVTLLDKDRNSVDIKVRSRSTSRRMLRKRAAKMLGRNFAFLNFAPPKAPDVVEVQMNINL